ncbi:hypothetical protein IRZ71_22590 [Flavobacterium sp. ANB]|nr:MULTISPECIES: hypothetical protein [unclassified Flavobacterium]MBF4519152.1 hypothetical protein [Flavobacterium sp. ANB]MTD71648.1 hypothetical protein [Flavobacterium sp. LC2016-13]
MKKKPKSEVKKLSLEKFRVAEIKNMKIIKAGDYPEEGDPPVTSPTVRG